LAAKVGAQARRCQASGCSERALVAVLGGEPTAEGRAARDSLGAHSLNATPASPPLRDRRSGSREKRGALGVENVRSFRAETLCSTRTPGPV